MTDERGAADSVEKAAGDTGRLIGNAATVAMLVFICFAMSGGAMATVQLCLNMALVCLGTAAVAYTFGAVQRMARGGGDEG